MIFALLFWAMVSGPASIYWFGDGYSGPHLASCNGRDPITLRYPCQRCFFPHSKGIAHRWLPLGTKGLLCKQDSAGLDCITTVVRDRGPWGAKRGTRWQKQVGKLKKGWKRRAEFDVMRATARRLGVKPFDRLMFFYHRKVSQ